MQNYHALETEAAHRRCEWERTAVARTQLAQTHPLNGGMRWSHLPRLVVERLCALSAPRLSFTASRNTSAGRTWLPRPLEEVAPV
jgi:hypothetical protein